MTLTFDKMHGLGNDFIVINGMNTPLPTPEQMIFLADRKCGIGFDQLLYITAATSADSDFHYQIFNADGSEVEQCGNGVRCVAAYIKHHQLSSKSVLTLTCLAGPIIAHFENDDQVKVNMGVLNQPIKTLSAATPFQPQPCDFVSVNLGNPHAVLFVEDVTTFDLAPWGKWCNDNVLFPDGVNLEIVQRTSNHQLTIRVFERGVGETQACGTGACAAAIASAWQHQHRLPTTVQLPGGALSIDWQGTERDAIWMTGPACHVYSGQIALP